MKKPICIYFYTLTVRELAVWDHPATIARSNGDNKSLAAFSFNTAMGCDYGCLFCCAPHASAKFVKTDLRPRGIKDPEAQWGQYALPRLWDKSAFLSKLRTAENTAVDDLSRGGHRAVLFSSTSDPYQIIPHADPALRRALTQQARSLVRRALFLIRTRSTLNVRMLTRSPLAREDFALFKKFGPRLMFGMSIPTLRDDLAKIYEPKAPPPSERLATLRAAREMGLNIYVAVSPTYPECDEDDLRNTLKAVAELEPLTIFHEPINIRGRNIARIHAHALEHGIKWRSDVFESDVSWQDYAIGALCRVQSIARELGIEHRLHLWPDKVLGSRDVIARMPHPRRYEKWIRHWWTRTSEWPSD